MDNTLFDFVLAQQTACRAVLHRNGQDGDPDRLFTYFRRQVHGFEHHDNIRDFLIDTGAFSDHDFALCCQIYETEKVAAIEPYPGIVGILESLRKQKVPLGIITDADAAHAAVRLERAGLSRFFATVVTPDRSGAAKPDPASFLLALDELGVEPGETVLAGDSIRRDIAPAQNLRMVTVYAQYGDSYWPAGTDSCTPDYVARTVSELGIVLNGLTEE